MRNRVLLGVLLSFGLSGVASAAGEGDKTCGQMIAEKAVLPAKMAEVMTAVTNMFDAHAQYMLEGKTKEGKKEADYLKKLAKNHRDLATSFTRTADMMKKASDLPGAPHDHSKIMADPKISQSMKEMLRTHKEMVALLQKEVAEMEAMMGTKSAAAPGAPSKN